MKSKFYFILIFLVSCVACSKKNTLENPTLIQSLEQVWTAPQTAQKQLQQIAYDQLNTYEQHRYALAEAHVQLKLYSTIPPHISTNDLAWYFLAQGDAASASEAYYIQGAYLNWLGENTQAMQYLKEAENLATTPIIRGMTYYKMGRISESEQLYDIALENYHKALPHLIEADVPLYLASVYRELGRMSDISSRDSFFYKALEQAQVYGDTILYLDIRHAQLSADQSHTPEIAQICQYLCNEAGIKRYAYDLVKYYIRSEKADSARIYLDILAADTTAKVWSEQQYTLWHSQYLNLKGQNADAYQELYNLYTMRYNTIEEKGRSSAYVVSQHYDNEAEHARNLQLQLEKQRLYIVLALLLIAVLSAAIVLIQYNTRRRTERLIQEARTQQQINDLQNELVIRREAIKRSLDQRIYLSKSLQETILTKQKVESIPEWAKDFIEMNIFSTEEQWQRFLKEFEGAYGGLLTNMQNEYNRLTSTDLQVIALYILGMDNSDICLLMGLTQRTIWSRRMRIKSRVGLGEKESLDKWIKERLEVKGERKE